MHFYIKAVYVEIVQTITQDWDIFVMIKEKNIVEFT